MKFKRIRQPAASVVLISVISKMDITEIEITNLSTYIILFRYKTERYYIILLFIKDRAMQANEGEVKRD